MVQYVGVEAMGRLVRSTGAEAFVVGLAKAIEDDFRRWESFEKAARSASHSPHGVIELMPTSDGELYAFKYVNGHPGNTATNRLTVTGLGVLSDVSSGYPLLLAEMTLLTALRTGATSALAAKYLARRDARSMAIVGLGAQSEFQALAFKAILGVDRLRVFDVDGDATDKFLRNVASLGVVAVRADSPEDAVRGVDVVTTATADKRHATVIEAWMLRDGVHVNAVGGDCPGKTELHPDVLRLGPVFVEFEEQTRVEGEIQLLPADFPVTELWRVVTGEAKGRVDDTDVTIFDSVGFAVEDFAALRYVRDLAAGPGAATLDVVPSLDDAKDLFSILDGRRNGASLRVA